METKNRLKHFATITATIGSDTPHFKTATKILKYYAVMYRRKVFLDLGLMPVPVELPKYEKPPRVRKSLKAVLGNALRSIAV